MSEQQTPYSWDDVTVEETVTEADHASSESLDFENFVGRAVCTVLPAVIKEKSMGKENFFVAAYKFRIDKVLTIEQPVIGEDGKPIMRDPEPWETPAIGSTKVPVMRKQEPKPENIDKINAMFVGTFLFDDIGLQRDGEKEFFKRRRLFFLKKVGVLGPNDTKVTKKMMAVDVNGRQVIVETGRNPSKDKTKCYVNVLSDKGYEHVDTLGMSPVEELDI